MQNQNPNPFVLPGLGQAGDMSANPLVASMEMMRRAWQGLAGSGGLDAGNMALPMSVEDLDRRIRDLRAVENWLRLNLSMLTSTIQGLEVQRATIATLRTFMSGTDAAASASALEALWGKTAGAATDTQAAQNASQSSEHAKDASSDASTAGSQAQAKQDAQGEDAAGVPGMSPAMAAQALAASQNWWNMVQQQFDNIAAATAATLQGAEAASAGAAASEPADKESKRSDAAARQPVRKSASARKGAARKTSAARKRAPRKSNPPA